MQLTAWLILTLSGINPIMHTHSICLPDNAICCVMHYRGEPTLVFFYIFFYISMEILSNNNIPFNYFSFYYFSQIFYYFLQYLIFCQTAFWFITHQYYIYITQLHHKTNSSTHRNEYRCMKLIHKLIKDWTKILTAQNADDRHLYVDYSITNFQTGHKVSYPGITS